MKAYKIEVLVIDTDEIGKESIVEYMETVKYPNYCMGVKVMDVTEKEIGEFDDDHPLNKKATMLATYQELFNSKNEVTKTTKE